MSHIKTAHQPHWLYLSSKWNNKTDVKWMQRWLLYICSVLITWSTSSTCRTEIKAPEVGVWRAQKDEATDANKEWNQFMVISLMSPVVWWERTNEFSAQPTNHVACLWLQTVVPLMVGNNFLNQQSGLFVCVFIELKKNLFGWGFNERCDPPSPLPLRAVINSTKFSNYGFIWTLAAPDCFPSVSL